LPHIEFKIKCSKGTYIRAIARDFGEKLNNAAHLTSLRRTEIGNYSTNKALSVEQLEHLFS
jgi:tRNA pseudouridine55 synthase